MMLRAVAPARLVLTAARRVVSPRGALAAVGGKRRVSRMVGEVRRGVATAINDANSKESLSQAVSRADARLNKAKELQRSVLSVLQAHGIHDQQAAISAQDRLTVAIFGSEDALSQQSLLNLLLENGPNDSGFIASGKEASGFVRIVDFGPAIKETKSFQNLTREIEIPSQFLKTQNLRLIEFPAFDQFSQWPSEFHRLLESADMMVHVTDTAAAKSLPIEQQLRSRYQRGKPWVDVIVAEGESKPAADSSLGGVRLAPRRIVPSMAAAALQLPTGSTERRDMWSRSGMAEIFRLLTVDLGAAERRQLAAAKLLWTQREVLSRAGAKVEQSLATVRDLQARMELVAQQVGQFQKGLHATIGMTLSSELQQALRRVRGKSVFSFVRGWLAAEEAASANKKEKDAVMQNVALQPFWWTAEQLAMYELGRILERSVRLSREWHAVIKSAADQIGRQLDMEDPINRTLLHRVHMHVNRDWPKEEGTMEGGLTARAESILPLIDHSRRHIGVLEEQWLGSQRAAIVIVQGLGIQLSGIGLAGAAFGLGYSNTLTAAVLAGATAWAGLHLRLRWSRLGARFHVHAHREAQHLHDKLSDVELSLVQRSVAPLEACLKQVRQEVFQAEQALQKSAAEISRLRAEAETLFGDVMRPII